MTLYYVNEKDKSPVLKPIDYLRKSVLNNTSQSNEDVNLIKLQQHPTYLKILEDFAGLNEIDHSNKSIPQKGLESKIQE